MGEPPRALDTESLTNAVPVNAFHVRVAILGALVLFWDGFNTQVIGYITPELARHWQIPHDMLGPIFSAGLAGVLVGQLGVAPLSARFGSKWVIIACTAGFGALTFLTTYAVNANLLIVFRFLTGIGLGGAQPVAAALIAEYCPKRHRSTFLVFGNCGVTFGSMGAGVLAAALLGRSGWQSVLWVGGALPLCYALFLVVALPESLAYLANGGRNSRRLLRLLGRTAPGTSATNGPWLPAGAKRRGLSAIGELFLAGRTTGTLALWCGLFMNMMVYYFVQNWLTTVLVEAGQDPQTAITVSLAVQVGGILAAFFVGPLMDRLDPYKVLGCLFCAASGCMVLMGAAIALPPPFAIAAAFCVGFCLLGLMKGVIALAVVYYPVTLRPAGVGWALGMGRTGAIIGPMAAGLLLGLGLKTPWLFYLSAGPMLIGAGAMLALCLRYGKGRNAATAWTPIAGQTSAAMAASPQNAVFLPVTPAKLDRASVPQ